MRAITVTLCVVCVGARAGTTTITLDAELAQSASLEQATVIANDAVRRTSAAGAMQPWVPDDSLNVARWGHVQLEHRGVLYVVGGDSGGCRNDIEYAPLTPTGHGAWTVNPTTLLVPRRSAGAVATKGFLYVVAGYNCMLIGGNRTEVELAPILPSGALGAFTQTSPISGGRSNVAVAAWDGWLYALGGWNAQSSTFYGDVQRARIRGDGSLEPWMTLATSAFAPARFGHGALAWNGWLYFSGGCTAGAASCSTYVGDVQMAPIGPDGTLGAWRQTTPLPQPRANHGYSADTANVFLSAGENDAGVLGSTAFAPLSASGIPGAWRSGPSLSPLRSDHAATAAAGRVFVTGGKQGSTTYGDSLVAAVVAGGVGGWSIAPNVFPTGRRSHASFVTGGQLYVLGGCADLVCSAASALGDAWRTPLGSGGATGAFVSAGTALPSGRGGHTAVAMGGFVYVVGGRNGSTTMSEVAFAPIAAGGNLGPWSTTAALPSPRQRHASVSFGPWVYVLGGDDGNGIALSEVRFAAQQINGQLGPWTATTPLPQTRHSLAAAVDGATLWVVGGSALADAAEVWRATIGANGALGAWQAQTSLPAPRRGADAVVYEGQLYVVGGFSGGAPSTDVLVSDLPVSVSRSLVWHPSLPLPGPRASLGSAVSHGTLYVTGGDDGSTGMGFRNDVALAKLPVTPNGAWTASGVLMTGVSGHTSHAVNGRVYTVGATTAYASVASDGTVGPWTPTSGFGGVGLHGGAAYGQFLYAAGGLPVAMPMPTAKTYYTQINSDGSLALWQNGPPLPAPRTGLGLVAWAGALYAIGGDGQPDVSIAILDAAAGTPAPWQAGPPLPQGVNRARVEAYDGYVYVIGGATAAGVALRDVWFARVIPGGGLGAWTQTTSLPTGRSGHASVAQDGRLYVSGGIETPNELLVAAIHSDGQLGAWLGGEPLAGAHSSHALALAGGWLVSTGGSSSQTEVRVSSTGAPAAVGRYSRRFDLGAQGTVSSVLINGSPGARGTVSLAYSTAPDSGVYGGSVAFGPIPLGTPAVLNVGATRFLDLSFTLDDSLTAAVDVEPANDRDILDITIETPGGVGQPCTSPAGCANTFCTDGFCCNSACSNACDVCAASLGAMADGQCTTAPATVTCRAAAGPCDLPEQCTGSMVTCPGDAYAGSTLVCRASTGACDPAETCGGLPSCPPDVTMGTCADGGVDGGATSSDGGVVVGGDAGLDAGIDDAGVDDAGLDDAGARRRRVDGGPSDGGADITRLGVACGCSSGGMLPLLALAAIALSRRRTRQRRDE